MSQSNETPPPPLKPSTLSSAHRRRLKAEAHHLRPVVQIGQAGITEGVIEATRAALAHHELIKISINGESPTERKQGAQALSIATGAHNVQVVGRVLTLFRETDRPQIPPSRSVQESSNKETRTGERGAKKTQRAQKSQKKQNSKRENPKRKSTL